MPHKVDIQLQVDNSKIRLSTSFEDDEWADIEAFIEYSYQLQKVKLVRDPNFGRFTLKYDINKGVAFDTEVPSDDELIVLLHKLRPFILQKEATYFNRIRNLVSRRLDDSIFREFLRKLRDLYTCRRFQSLIKISSNNVIINSEEILFKWLNAHEFHKDRDKQDELKSLHKILPLDASQSIFVLILFEKLKAILILTNILEAFSGRKNRIKLNI